MHLSNTTAGVSTSEDELARRLNKEKKLLAELRYVMSSTLAKVGIDEALTIIPRKFNHQELIFDRYDQSTGLYLEWHNSKGQIQGHVCVHADHQVYAEFDLLRRHPIDRMWMIEAIEAWGSLGEVKAELRLMPALAEL